MTNVTVKDSFYAYPGKMEEFRTKLGMKKCEFCQFLGAGHIAINKLNAGGMTYRGFAERIAATLGVDPGVIFIDYCPKYHPDSNSIRERNEIICGILDEIKWTSMKYGKDLMKVRGSLYDIDDVISTGYLYALEAVDKALFRKRQGECVNKFTAYACGAARRGLQNENRKWRASIRDGSTISFELFEEKEDTIPSSFCTEDYVVGIMSFYDILSCLNEKDFKNLRVLEVLESLGIFASVSD